MKWLLGLCALIALSAVISRGLSATSKPRTPLGSDAGLSPCPSTPNCVSSLASDDKAIDPLPLKRMDDWAKLLTAMGARVITKSERYLHATFTTPLMGYVDDLELWHDADASAEPSATHVKSTSRLGHSDLGANRKRVEAIRAKS
ncbi:MAG: DUF1499 domain-containing protein [Gammaproteobacteria bacterium]|nr:DUF1499 domain-containing protein [Gammaproteobacteria bacterium]